MKKLTSILTVLMILAMSLSAFSASAAEEKKSLSMSFDKPEASRTMADEQSLTPADYQIFAVDWAGKWNTGVVGYDEEEKLLYSTSPEGGMSSNVIRVRFTASSDDKFVSGETFQYARVQYMLKADLMEGATYTMQFRDAAWMSAPINIEATPNEWHDDPVDLRTLTSFIKKGKYDIGGGDVRDDVGGGMGTDIATQALMLQVEAQGNLVGAKLYIKSITFYESKAEAFGLSEEETPADTPDPLEIKFNTANAVKGGVADDQLNDYYLGGAHFDLAVGGADGTIGFDATEGYVFGTRVEGSVETLACGTRFFINAKNPIGGSKYRYAKIRFKSTMPITKTTIIALRDAASHWGYYGVTTQTARDGDWYEAVIDTQAAHSHSPVADWSTAAVGLGNTLCLEILDAGLGDWVGSYGGDFRIFLDYITFSSAEPEIDYEAGNVSSDAGTSTESKDDIPSVNRPTGGTKPPSYLKEETTVDVGLVIGIVAAVVVVLAAAVVVILIVVKKKKAAAAPAEEAAPTEEPKEE